MGDTPLTDMTSRGAKNKWSISQIIRGLSGFFSPYISPNKETSAWNCLDRKKHLVKTSHSEGA